MPRQNGKNVGQNGKNVGQNGKNVGPGQGTGHEVNPKSWTQHLLFICEEEH